jgi:hypothetical protein
MEAQRIGLLEPHFIGREKEKRAAAFATALK